MLWATIVGMICILITFIYSAYRQAWIEQKVVAEFLSKSPGGQAKGDSLPTWRSRLCDLLCISRPVTKLSLEGKQINDDHLAKLKSLKYLKELSIDQCPITDDGVKEIAKVRTLTHLDLFGCNGVTDASLTHIKTMQSLSELYILSNRISGHSFQKLSALQYLRELDLSGCSEISDNAVKPLGSLTQLVQLDIRYTAISEKGVEKLERALPNTMILSDY